MEDVEEEETVLVVVVVVVVVERNSVIAIVVVVVARTLHARCYMTLIRCGAADVQLVGRVTDNI